MSTPIGGTIHAMHWSLGQMETIRETYLDELPDRERLELEIAEMERVIARLSETPFVNSLAHKQERLNQLKRLYAEIYGKG